ncbi:MAG: beta/gamma crystallin-related protein, partial [Betaproteobacteria bacterium]
MNWKIKSALAATTVLLATHAAAQISFYEDDGFRGRVFSANTQVNNFGNHGFNDRASSVVVDRGRWEVCSDAQFRGQCVVLRQGSYASLGALGMNDKISSVRPVNQRAVYQNEAPAPLPAPIYEYRQRPNERTYEAPVTSVHAVVGPPEQRCWVERQQVTDRGNANVGGAVVGALLGGVLGHQVGGGRGRDVATAGGA